MKFIVTGGAGFVGSHLCERLSESKENQVYSLDNYFTGTKDNHIEGVTYIEGSTSSIDELELSSGLDFFYKCVDSTFLEIESEVTRIDWEWN